MSSSDSTPLSTLLEFKQFCPRHSPHEILHSNPCFLQKQRRVSQFVLQLQRIMERSFSGAGRFFVFMGIILSLLINQPNSQASSSSPPIHIFEPDSIPLSHDIQRPRLLVEVYGFELPLCL